MHHTVFTKSVPAESVEGVVEDGLDVGVVEVEDPQLLPADEGVRGQVLEVVAVQIHLNTKVLLSETFSLFLLKISKKVLLKEKI